MSLPHRSCFANGAPLVVFTGHGSETVSEAEIYATAARWLGVPQEVTALDPWPISTAERPLSPLKLGDPRLTRTSRLIVVTSPTHARRALLTFRQYRFTQVVIVTNYGPRRAADAALQRLQKSAFAGFKP